MNEQERVMAMLRCTTCRWWKRNADSSGMGLCTMLSSYDESPPLSLHLGYGRGAHIITGELFGCVLWAPIGPDSPESPQKSESKAQKAGRTALEDDKSAKNGPNRPSRDEKTAGRAAKTGIGRTEKNAPVSGDPKP